MSKFWQIKNEADAGNAELLLYGPISDTSWWGDEVTPKQFADDLAALGGKAVTVRINSPGGDVFAAHAIYNQLRSYKGDVTIMVDGLAASAATIVMMAGKTVVMPSNAMAMIHNPMLILWGYYDAGALDKMAAALEEIKESIISAYLTKSNLERKKLAKLMDDETWMTAETAKEYGFADEVQDLGAALNAVIDGNFLVVNSVKHDLSRVKNATGLRTALDVCPAAPPPPAAAADTSILVEAKKLLSTVVSMLTPKNQEQREEPELKFENAEDLRKAHPELVNQIEAQARTGAVAAEQARITALDALGDPANPTVQALVADAKASGKTADDIKNAVEIVKKNTPAPAVQNKGEGWLKNLAADTTASGVNGVGTEGAGGQGDAQEEAAAVNHMASVINKKFGKEGKQ